MTAIEDAKTALSNFDRAGVDTVLTTVPAVVYTLRELIAEHERLTADRDYMVMNAEGLYRSGVRMQAELERLTTPTSDDEREALARAHFDDWRRIHPGTLTWATYGESHKQRFYDLADVAIGAGFRRQGPITDAQVRAEALRAYATELDGIYPVELWPEVTDDQLAQLHEFARSIGLPDGSRFHVGGIRHARNLMRAEADRIEHTNP